MRLILTLILGWILFFFHLRYLSRFFDWDSCVYALNIGRERLYSVFLNPHHLGFESTGLLYWKWVHSYFPEADLMFSLRIRILLFSILFLGLNVWFYYKMYRDYIGGILVSLMIGFSQGFWFYSYHNDTPMIHSCLISLVYMGTIITSKMNKKKWPVLGLFVLQFFNIMFHQSDAIFFPLVPIMILYCSYPNSIGKGLHKAAIYSITLGLLVMATYAFVGFIILERNLTGPGEKHFTFWMFLYAALNRWGTSGLEKNYSNEFFRGIGDAFLNYQGVNTGFRVDFSDSLLTNQINHFPYNFNVLFWILVILLFLIGFRNFFKKFPLEFLLLSFWILPSIAFYSWWEGYFFEFWVGTAIGLTHWAYLVFRSISWDHLFPRTSRAILHLGLSVMILLYFSVNFTYSALPRSKKVWIGYVEGFREDAERLARERIYRDIE